MSAYKEQPAANEPEPAVVRKSRTTEPAFTQKKYDNTPSFKRKRDFQKQLAKLVAAREKGDLQKLGRAAIKRYVQCGDNRAQALQTELVTMGLAAHFGNSVKWTPPEFAQTG